MPNYVVRTVYIFFAPSSPAGNLAYLQSPTDSDELSALA